MALFANTWQENLWTCVSGIGSPAVTTSGNTLLGNTTTGGGSGRLLLPANYFNFPGKGLYFKFTGQVSIENTAAMTIGLNVMFINSTGGSVSVFGTGGIGANTGVARVIQANWDIDFTLIARAVGPKANIFGWGLSTCINIANAYGRTLAFPNTAPTTGTTFDGTIDQILDVQPTFSVADANNLIILTSGYIKALN